MFLDEYTLNDISNIQTNENLGWTQWDWPESAAEARIRDMNSDSTYV